MLLLLSSSERQVPNNKMSRRSHATTTTTSTAPRRRRLLLVLRVLLVLRALDSQDDDDYYCYLGFVSLLLSASPPSYSSVQVFFRSEIWTLSHRSLFGQVHALAPLCHQCSSAPTRSARQCWRASCGHLHQHHGAHGPRYSCIQNF